MASELRPIRRSYYKFKEIFESVKYGPEFSSTTDREILRSYGKIISDDNPATKHVWKPVDHKKWDFTNVSLGSYTLYDDMADLSAEKVRLYVKNYAAGDPITWLENIVMPQVAMMTTLQPPDWDTIAQSVAPSLRNEFNTINFLLEFDDVRKAIPDALKLLKNVKRSLPKILRGRDSEVLGRTAVDGFLQYNLGVKPLISDGETLLENTKNALDETTKRSRQIQRAIERLERGLRGSVLRPYSHIISQSYEGTIGYEGLGKLRLDGWIEVRDHVHVAGSYPGGNPLAAFLDGAGLYPDLYTLWNAVPFSFLVDYVLPVGDTLEAEYGSWSWAQLLDSGGGLRLIDALTSLKLVCKFEYEAYPFVPPGPIGTVSGDVATDIIPLKISGTYELYQRWKPPASLDGIDLKFEDKEAHTKGRQSAIAAGIMANGLKDKTRRPKGSSPLKAPPLPKKLRFR